MTEPTINELLKSDAKRAAYISELNKHRQEARERKLNPKDKEKLQALYNELSWLLDMRRGRKADLVCTMCEKPLGRAGERYNLTHMNIIIGEDDKQRTETKRGPYLCKTCGDELTKPRGG